MAVGYLIIVRHRTAVRTPCINEEFGDGGKRFMKQSMTRTGQIQRSQKSVNGDSVMVFRRRWSFCAAGIYPSRRSRKRRKRGGTEEEIN